MRETLLSKEDFNLEVVRELRKKFTNAISVELKTVVKLNNSSKVGVFIRLFEEDCAPIIYLDNYYEEYCATEILDTIVEDIVTLVVRQGDNKPINKLADMVRSFEDVKDNIMFKLVNLEANKLYLYGKPFAKFNNLAMIFFIHINKEATDGIQSITITEEMCKMWKVDSTELLVVAMKNTPERFKYTLRSMKDIIMQMMEHEGSFEGLCDVEDLNLDDSNEMLVLTNEIGVNGAAVIMYPGVLKEIAEKLDSDLIILPSSIHEVIIIKACNGKTAGDLGGMVSDINGSQVAPDEVLSNTPYIYKKDVDKIVIM